MQTSLEILAHSRYLNFPVKPGAPKRLVSIHGGQELLHQFEIELAPPNAADFWVFLDISPLKGQRLRVTLETPGAAAHRVDADGRGAGGAEGETEPVASLHVVQTDTIGGAAAPREDLYKDLYKEARRPQFHFSSRRGWLNDPNGLLYYRGLYHLFYQHNPYGTRWGNMHWGHAVSRDLVHWTEVGVALYPDDMGTMFSGSGVVDAQNTSGFKTGEEDPLVLFYTAAGGTSARSQGKRFVQCLAYSVDGGKTWRKYEGNPVVDHIAGENRDPKVVWHEPTRRWVMALYLENHRYTLLSSPDLKTWTRLSDVTVPDCDECPDLFALPLDGDPSNVKWVFWGANGSYLVGDFDGKRFYPLEHVRVRSNQDASCYAAQTWSNAPDGRCIQIAWFQCDLPGMPFNNFMTFPCELSLRTTEDGMRLFFEPVREIEALYERRYDWEAEVLRAGKPVTKHIDGELLDIAACIEVGTASEVELAVGSSAVRYSVPERHITCGGRRMPLKVDQGMLRLRILVDRVSFEIFGNGGALYMPVALPEHQAGPLTVTAFGGEAKIRSLRVVTLKPAWEPPRPPA